MIIELESKILKITKINRKTSAKMFKDLEVGDKISMRIPLKKAGMNRGTTYASYITIVNLEDGNTVHKSFNELPNIIDAFEFEELESDEYSRLVDAEYLLSEAQSLLSNVHCYDTDIYREISKFLWGEDDE